MRKLPNRIAVLAWYAVPAMLAPALLAAQTVAVGEGHLLRLQEPAGTVFVANPEVADVQVPDPNSVFVLGKRAGTTTLYVLGEDGHTLLQRQISVRHNLTELQATLRQRFPQRQLVLESAPGSLLIRGTVENAAEVQAIEATLRPYLGPEESLINQLTLSSPVQVMLRVRVTEVSRSLVQQLGINWAALAAPGNFVTGLISGRTFQQATANLLGNSYSSAGDGYSFLGGYVQGNYSVQAMIDLLDREGLISILAEPNLTAVSGETASFLAGGEFPIPVRQDQDTMSVEFKSFGVALDFTPTVLSNDRISLKVRPEISEIDPNYSVVMEGITVPGVSIRRVETTVEMASGESFAIGGLLQNNTRDLLSKVPGLSTLPILGRLFRSTDYRNNRSELVVIVTPYLVRPTGPGQLRSPLDSLRPTTELERLIHFRTGLDPVEDSTPRLAGSAGFAY